MILLAHEVVVFLFLEALLLGLLTGAVVPTVRLLHRWDFQATTAEQYGLEKQAYLVGLLLMGGFVFKILLLPFFAHMVDGLAALVPGAMCGAGVINANGFGGPLLTLKIVVLALAGLWLLVNHQDLQAVDYPHFRAKLWLFLVIYAALLGEAALDVAYLTHISTLSPVQCCSVIYGVAGAAPALPLGLDTRLLLWLFYLLYALVVVLSLARYNLLAGLANLGFLYIGYHAVVYFFGTYVYQLPTHQCPFCMLQKEYVYVGYLIWGTLLLGTFSGTAGWWLRWILGRDVRFAATWSLICHTVFVLVCSLYVLVYYLKNGVLLT